MQGFYGWVNANLRGRKGQRGFTLIELLVVVTILGILAGIVTLSLVGLTSHASVESCNQEYKTVQAAIDAYMANNNVSTITAQSAYTNNMQTNLSISLWTDAPSQSQPNYTRNGTTVYYYEWNSAGRIIGVATNSSGGTLSGCSLAGQP
ncbi:MAG TPA: prepilin-type N-terminal cleavage/methylation domain-containing protein [Candidatus Dormibacteraeota bacterium]|jgi:prepilin-type N-terminal cleavage/methylation domain-containing protein